MMNDREWRLPIKWSSDSDNGNPYQIIPPCAGGSLAEVLIEFYDGMV